MNRNVFAVDRCEKNCPKCYRYYPKIVSNVPNFGKNITLYDQQDNLCVCKICSMDQYGFQREHVVHAFLLDIFRQYGYILEENQEITNEQVTHLKHIEEKAFSGVFSNRESKVEVRNLQYLCVQAIVDKNLVTSLTLHEDVELTVIKQEQATLCWEVIEKELPKILNDKVQIKYLEKYISQNPWIDCLLTLHYWFKLHLGFHYKITDKTTCEIAYQSNLQLNKKVVIVSKVISYQKFYTLSKVKAYGYLIVTSHCLFIGSLY